MNHEETESKKVKYAMELIEELKEKVRTADIDTANEIIKDIEGQIKEHEQILAILREVLKSVKQCRQ